MPRFSISDLMQTRAYINGKWESQGEPFSVINPANGEELAKVSNAATDDYAHAIDAADAAFPDWSQKTGKERGAVLHRWYELIIEHQDALAEIMTREQGKPLKESKGEIAYGAEFVQWFAEEAKRVYGDVIPTHANGKRLIALKQPVGVCASITPWNFPNAMITRKISPALAAGCTIVAKPAEATPLSALALAVLAEEAGFPSGVINILPTDNAKQAGEELCRNPKVRKLSFTGSTSVGKQLMEQCAGTVKKLSLELGGNAPFIVFDDADVDQAVEGLIASKFRNAGQTCVSANRIFVQQDIYGPFTKAFTEAITKLKVGNSMEDGVDIGPLINNDAIEKVTKLVKDAKDNGAKILYEADNLPDGERFYAPTVLSRITPEMNITNTEIFGPVVSILEFKTEDEVIKLANDTPYGLAAYFYARDVGRIWRVAEGLDYGMVGINEGMISTEVAPFGGVKESGFGREGSKYGIEEYVEIKYLCLGGIER